MLSLKQGEIPASAAGFKPEILLAIMVADGAYTQYGHECVITSGTDGEHSEGSLHYEGLAVDFRTVRHGMGDDEIESLAAVLRKRLGQDYEVVVEATHIHVEFDPK